MPELDERGRLQSPELTRDGDVPIVQPLPELADMVALSDAELLETLQRLGVMDPAQELRADVEAYVARVSRITDPAAFAAEVERLLDQGNHRALLGMTRRVQERYTTLRAADGDKTFEFIRISEGDTHVCDECARLEGEIGTLDYHAGIGMPGAQSCLGGDYCRCQLVRIAK